MGRAIPWRHNSIPRRLRRRFGFAGWPLALFVAVCGAPSWAAILMSAAGVHEGWVFQSARWAWAVTTAWMVVMALLGAVITRKVEKLAPQVRRSLALAGLSPALQLAALVAGRIDVAVLAAYGVPGACAMLRVDDMPRKRRAIYAAQKAAVVAAYFAPVPWWAVGLALVADLWPGPGQGWRPPLRQVLSRLPTVAEAAANAGQCAVGGG